MDSLTPAARSAHMARIKSSGTLVEKVAAEIVRSLGLRCRRNARRLPGTPDLALPVARLAVFANGCFWHGRPCRGGKIPSTNRAYWRSKIERNRRRDARVFRALRRAGWGVVVLRECRLRRPAGRDEARRRIKRVSGRKR